MSSEFKLEAGKKYVDRRGRVYGPMIQNCGRFDEVQDSYGWGGDGRRNHSGESQIDLVAEYVEPAPVEYRLLDEGEIIQSGDEWKCGKSWISEGLSVGKKWRSHLYVPHRRRVEPPTPVESPDDWVVQDRVPPRAGIDQVGYTDKPGLGWCDAQGKWFNVTHGSDTGCGILQVRCRRRHLPPLPPVQTKIPVRLWASERITYENGDWPVRCGENPPPQPGSWVEIHPSPDGFFVTKQS
jgi:hypothetical protein